MPLMASASESALIFEEAYPSTDMLLRAEDEPRAVETILQVDVSDSRVAPTDQNGG